MTRNQPHPSTPYCARIAARPIARIAVMFISSSSFFHDSISKPRILSHKLIDGDAKSQHHLA
ncbi:MAG: hypothetical protein ACRDC6_19970 [Shewanella sp.]